MCDGRMTPERWKLFRYFRNAPPKQIYRVTVELEDGSYWTFEDPSYPNNIQVRSTGDGGVAVAELRGHFRKTRFNLG